MAVRYWDYWKSSTSTSSTSGYWDAWGSGTTSSNSTFSTYTSGVTTATWIRFTPREYVVTMPDHWDEAVTATFVRLINDETNTGFTVKMVMQGDVLITDPSIEKRSMEDFAPLLLRKAMGKDHERIQAFFDAFLLKREDG